MNVLVVSATVEEIQILKERLSRYPVRVSVEFLVTGIGMVATAYALTRQLQQQRYDLVLAVGVAGAIDSTLSIGQVVRVSQDLIYNFGVEDGPEIKSFPSIGLPGEPAVVPCFPFSSKLIDELPAVKAVSVNTAHGDESSIAKLRRQTDAAIENMEGAAFFYVCNQEEVNCLQLRAISNRVERRNRESWDLPKALQQLSEVTYSLLKTL